MNAPTIAKHCRVSSPLDVKFQPSFRAALVVIVALTAALRVFCLLDLPLSATEASTAASAWKGDLDSVSPVSGALTALALFFSGPSDLAARFFPTLAGILAVALAGGTYPLLGKRGAATLALVLATAPGAAYAAGRVGDESVALMLGTLLLFCLACARSARWTIAAAATLGALVSAGVVGCSIAIGVVVAFLVARQRGWAPYSDLVASVNVNIKTCSLTALGAFLAIGTVVGMAPLALFHSGPFVWLSRFGAPAEWPFGYAPVLAFVQNPGLIVLPLLGVCVAVIGRTPGWPFYLTWLSASSALVVLAPGAQPVDGVALLLPLGCLAGYVGEELFKRDAYLGGKHGLISVCTAVILFFSIWSFATAQQMTSVALCAVYVIVCVIVLTSSLSRLDTLTRWRLLSLAGGVLLILAGLRATDTPRLTLIHEGSIPSQELATVRHDARVRAPSPFTPQAPTVATTEDYRWLADWYYAGYGRGEDADLYLIPLKQSAPADTSFVRRYAVSKVYAGDKRTWSEIWPLIWNTSTSNLETEEIKVYAR